MTIAKSISAATNITESIYSKMLWDSAASYVETCNHAASNDYIFNNFRQHPKYTEVLEHVSQELGVMYIEKILDDKIINLSEEGKEIQRNDLFGNPAVYDYGKYGIYSPTTLRYAKIVSDLKKIFSFDKKKISVVEIGVGYGGQCRLLSEYFTIKEYTLIDVTPALNLSKRYLEGYSLKCKIKFLTLNEIESINSDLCISNYAFSELNKNLQDMYLKKIIQHSNNGYMIYNHIVQKDFLTYNVYEFAEKIRQNIKIMQEIPLTHPKNKIICWGKNIIQDSIMGDIRTDQP